MTGVAKFAGVSLSIGFIFQIHTQRHEGAGVGFAPEMDFLCNISESNSFMKVVLYKHADMIPVMNKHLVTDITAMIRYNQDESLLY